MRSLVAALSILTAAGSTPVESWWGASAHRAIATVATTMLTAPARERAAALLGGQSLTAVATWADDIRRSARHTAGWHYVNIPVEEFRYDSARHCPGGNCIIEALRSRIRLLADSTAAPEARGEALRYVVHLVADLHQPLHVADRADRGGNDLRVSLETDRPAGGRADGRTGRADRRTDSLSRRVETLHAVWDYGLFEAVGLTEAALVNAVSRELGPDPARFQNGEVLDWAMEGHRIASKAYPPPGSTSLDRAWVEAGTRIALTQMARAAARLAMTVNQALDPDFRANPR